MALRAVAITAGRSTAGNRFPVQRLSRLVVNSENLPLSELAAPPPQKKMTVGSASGRSSHSHVAPVRELSLELLLRAMPNGERVSLELRGKI